MISPSKVPHSKEYSHSTFTVKCLTTPLIKQSRIKRAFNKKQT